MMRPTDEVDDAADTDAMYVGAASVSDADDDDALDSPDAVALVRLMPGLLRLYTC